MRVTPLGVGEAFDAEQPNSTAVVSLDGYSLLIDCGHSAVPLVWRAFPDPDRLDAVFLTHGHADHILGLPSVLDRWGYEGRRKTLTVVASPEVHGQLRNLFQLLGIKPQFPLDYVPATETGSAGPLRFRTAPTRHVIPNLAVRLEGGGRRLAYSGDGRPTPGSLALYADADMLLHECWEVDAIPDIPFHCDLPTAREIAGPPRIGLYHIRAGRRPAMEAATAGDPRCFVVQPGVALDV